MWLYEGEEMTKENFPKPAEDVAEESTFGFVYMMGAIIDGEKKFYIGRKTVYSPRKRKLNKKELAARPSKREKDWKWVSHFEKFHDYYSSNKVLEKAHEDGIEIKRIILHICHTKAEITFQETRHQFKAEVLSKPEFSNDNILGKFYRSKLYPETNK